MLKNTRASRKPFNRVGEINQIKIMENKEMSFEEINEHIAKADLKKFQSGGESHFVASAIATNPGQVLQKLCGIYKIVRPILVVISNFPLLPAAWKAAVKTFVSLMDTLCP